MARKKNNKAKQEKESDSAASQNQTSDNNSQSTPNNQRESHDQPMSSNQQNQPKSNTQDAKQKPKQPQSKQENASQQPSSSSASEVAPNQQRDTHEAQVQSTSQQMTSSDDQPKSSKQKNQKKSKNQKESKNQSKSNKNQEELNPDEFKQMSISSDKQPIQQPQNVPEGEKEQPKQRVQSKPKQEDAAQAQTQSTSQQMTVASSDDQPKSSKQKNKQRSKNQKESENQSKSSKNQEELNLDEFKQMSISSDKQPIQQPQRVPQGAKEEPKQRVEPKRKQEDAAEAQTQSTSQQMTVASSDDQPKSSKQKNKQKSKNQKESKNQSKSNKNQEELNPHELSQMSIPSDKQPRQQSQNVPQGAKEQPKQPKPKEDAAEAQTQSTSQQMTVASSDDQPKSSKQKNKQKSKNQKESKNQSKSNKNQEELNPDEFKQMSISSDKQPIQQPQKVPQGAKEQAKQRTSEQTTVAPSSATTSMPYLMCPYKGVGTRGTRFKSLLETNYLKLIINKMKDYAYHYDIVIEPDKPKKFMSKIFQQFCHNNFPGVGIAFDGARNAYAPMVLSLKEIIREVDFVHPETGGVRKYLVSIQETEDMRIPLNSLKTYQTTRQYDMPRRALQCIEIILKGAYQQEHLEIGIQAARSFYLPTTKREYLGDFFELWLGLFQSTVLGSNIYLNVDVAHKAFPERYESLLDLLKQIQNERRCDERNALHDMQSHLSGLDVIYKTPGLVGSKRVYRFLGLVRNPNQEKFKDVNGVEMTIAAYFKQHNYPINRPDLPCVKLGNAIKSITVPMEHCSLSDRQAINKKCTENQTRAIIKVAATSTDVRKQKIMALLNQVKHNQSPVIRGFGLEIDTNFAKVPARCLDAPKIQYAGNKLVEVKNGVWRGESMPFLIPESANKWAILNCNFRTRSDELKDLARILLKVSKSTNLNLADTPGLFRSADISDIRNIERELEIAKKEGIRILFCVIPDSGPTYAKIKKLAEMRIGVLTQCIKGNTVFKKRTDGSTISNILLKCNAKLNGTNHRLNNSPILYDKCMLIGADVTHPSPDQKNIPSVVGVAASHDANAFCYNVCWRLQGPRIEIIQDFKQIILEHLKFYRQKNGSLPNKILYYRDGVSEGQFQQVMASEKMAMTQACAEIQPGYEKIVKLSIIVVQKRHHTRFFPGNTEIGKNDRKNNNVPAGTIVDSEITHPNENHFYLVSHQSIQGVAKPTKYCILLDEANHSIDDLQGLSYNLCHLFSRCNRSVSYPAPTYYAHLAAYRGRVYIENERLDMDRLQEEWSTRAVRTDIIKNHPMFFV